MEPSNNILQKINQLTSHAQDTAARSLTFARELPEILTKIPDDQLALFRSIAVEIWAVWREVPEAHAFWLNVWMLIEHEECRRALVHNMEVSELTRVLQL